MSRERGLREIINTSGYVTMIEGEPGLGKTTLALYGCASRGDCLYISYSDPPESIQAKAERVGAKGVRVINALTGDPSQAFSYIQDGLSDDRLVIVDSIDAMLYGIREQESIRPFLEIVYSSAKRKKSSLALISEGSGGISSHVRYVCDAIISMRRENVLNREVRVARVLKDRDNPIEHSSYFISMLDGFRIVSPSLPDVHSKPRNVSYIKGPPEISLSYIVSRAQRVLNVLGDSVHPAAAETIRQWVAADFLKAGYSVNLITSPLSSEDDERKAIEAMLGSRADGLNVLRVGAGYGQSHRERLELIRKGLITEKAVNVVDLLADEAFAFSNPAGYEMFMYEMARIDKELSIPSILYGYQGYSSVATARKYAHMEWSIELINGVLFYITEKPNGPLYYIEADLGAGRAEFRRIA